MLKHRLAGIDDALFFVSIVDAKFMDRLTVVDLCHSSKVATEEGKVNALVEDSHSIHQ